MTDESDLDRHMRETRERLTREEAEKRNGHAGDGANGADHANYEELRQLRIDIGQLNANTPPEHISAIVDRIAACTPDAVIRDSLIKTVKAQTKVSVASMRKRIEENVRQARQKIGSQGWRDSLARNRDGEIYSTAANVLIVLRNAPEWQGVVALNEFNQQPMLVRKPPWANPWGKPQRFSDADEARTLVWIQQNVLPLCRIEAVRQALAVAIDDNRFHPVRDYLDSLKWDGTPRLDNWLTYYLGVEPIESYTNVAGPKWMISAVARIYQPGCQAKYVLILEGPQDLGKSTALEILGGEYFTDDVAELGTKDSALQAGNAWIIELAELDSSRKAHVAAVKAFISRKVDRFRKPFGRNIIHQERQCVMAGSINPGADYLIDDTGNVRFWPATCTSIDSDALRKDRDQLWAEAVHRYKNGEKWWIEDEDAINAALQEQEARVQSDSLTEIIANYLDDPSIEAITTTQLLQFALELEPRDHEKHRQTRIGIIMCRDLKWRRRKSGSRRWFERPSASDTAYPGIKDPKPKLWENPNPYDR